MSNKKMSFSLAAKGMTVYFFVAVTFSLLVGVPFWVALTIHGSMVGMTLCLLGTWKAIGADDWFKFDPATTSAYHGPPHPSSFQGQAGMPDYDHPEIGRSARY